MLKQVVIQNFVLIDALTLTFENGFSAFTGETGAGKSILIDAISLLCGARSSSDTIRHGQSKALVEGVFEIGKQHPVHALLEEYGFSLEEDTLVVTRELHADGKSVARLQHRQCSVSIMKEIVGSIIDIHSQHDNQYLLNPKHYLSLLDEFDRSDDEIRKKYEVAYQEYALLKKEYETFLGSYLNEADLDILLHQSEEIRQLDVKENEVEELEERAKLLGSIEKIQSKANRAISLLQKEHGVVEDLYEAKQALLSIHETNLFEEAGNQLDSLYFQLVDVSESVSDTLASLQMDENELNTIQERLFHIHRVIRKYGGSMRTMMSRLDEIEKQINQIEHRQEYIDDMERRIAILEKKALSLAQTLTQNRKSKAARLEEAVAKELKDLHLPSARFEIPFYEVPLGRTGMDQISFLISMNKGEQPKPLDKTASGGELSRFMLALKVIFTKLERIETVIFDEIDTGISGPTAFAIGKKMRQLANDAQVFSVTHLAQVAASANAHYHIEKKEQESSTVSAIHKLEGDRRVRQLALISSGNDSSASFEAARELLSLAMAE